MTSPITSSVLFTGGAISRSKGMSGVVAAAVFDVRPGSHPTNR